MTHRATLYSSPISDCSGRLRIALNLKGIPYDLITVSLRNRQNQSSEYLRINPAQTVPALVIHSSSATDKEMLFTLKQSIAALEYLEEAFPDTPQLLPPIHQPMDRAMVRSLVNIIATDIHPLTAHRVGREIRARFPCPETELAAAEGNREWDIHWIKKGLDAYEGMAQETAGRYSVGDEITLADVCLVPEFWTAKRLGVDLEEYPTVSRIYSVLSTITAIASAQQDPTPELA